MRCLPDSKKLLFGSKPKTQSCVIYSSTRFIETTFRRLLHNFSRNVCLHGNTGYPSANHNQEVLQTSEESIEFPGISFVQSVQPAPGWGLLRFTYLSSHTCSSRVVLPPPQLCVSSKVYLKLTVCFSASLSSLFSSLGCNCTQLNPRLLNASPSPPHHLSTCLKHIQKLISSALISAFFWCRHSRCFRELVVSERQLGTGGLF